LVNDTINANQGGGIDDSQSADASLLNVILFANGSPVAAGSDCNNGPVGSGTTSIGNCGVSGMRDLDPQLATLQLNGGSTLNEALADTSPAIGAGTHAGAPAVDQRGAPRSDPPSIGAYEFVLPTLTLVTHVVNSGGSATASQWTAHVQHA